MIDSEYVSNIAKQIKKPTAAIVKNGIMLKDKYGTNALSSTELYLVTNKEYSFDDSVDLKLRYYVKKMDIPPEEVRCPYCKERWLKYTRDKIKHTKYENLSTTCGSKECYGKFRSEYMKNLETNPSQREDVKRKKAETFKKHYGVDNIFKRSDLMQEYWKQSLGVDNPTKRLDIRQKAVTKTLKRNGSIEFEFRGQKYKLVETEVPIIQKLDNLKDYDIKPQYITKRFVHNGDRLYIPDVWICHAFSDKEVHIEIKAGVDEILAPINIAKFDSVIQYNIPLLVIIPQDYEGNVFVLVDWLNKAYYSTGRISRLDKHQLKFYQMPVNMMRADKIVDYVYRKIT